MTRRERVIRALDFRKTDKIPKDLGSMGATGISAFAYARLVPALGLPLRPIRIHDVNQMLALPDPDILDALDCDVALASWTKMCSSVDNDCAGWKPYDFNGRLFALVKDPSVFSVQKDGTIEMNNASGTKKYMPPASYVFDEAHGGQKFDFNDEIQKIDIDKLSDTLEKELPDSKTVSAIRTYLQRIRGMTDRAVMISGMKAELGFPGGLPQWSMLCMTDPEHAREVFRVKTQYAIEYYKRLLPQIKDYFDILMVSTDDQGTQNSTILPPQIFTDLYAPYYKMINEVIHFHAPGAKTFLHSCGAVYTLIETFIACGFDILNPVQWTAGGKSFKDWKDICRNRITLWGGGVDTQTMLPLGTLEDTIRQAREVSAYCSSDGGYVFCAIHNILAEIPAEKIIAMYRQV
ncbi:MAG TPA: hypothetical protein DC049_06235 [Spirochaetia bacterium]|nr:hypothetical protein [Spirochaetia bacterium]